MYHRRIQKKWNKRYGFKTVANVFRYENKLFCHPEVFNRVQEFVKNGTA
jgi:hypothetical protein